jgi:methanogenic corrinoid protein MtbC1
MQLEILGSLKKAVLEYDVEAAASWARKAVDEKVDPTKAMDALTSAIRQVGDGFGAGQLWLPDLVGAAEAMKAATPILEAEISRRAQKRETLGTVVIGTVYGDLHDIGKAMVSTLLTAEGFTVYDLGVNVEAQHFVDAIKEHQANVLALSALLTTTAPEMRKVIDTLEKEALRDKVKIMVGGGAITHDFADSIGADGYDPTAPGAAALARRLVGK